MKKTEQPIIVEQFIDQSKETIWAALTEKDQMVQWFFKEIPAFEPKVGFSTIFNIDSGERIFPHQWKILEVIPNEKIVYDWHYQPDYDGRGLVTFELIPEGDGTRVILTNRVVEDFTADIPEFKRESAVGGWNYFIREQLKGYFEK